MKDLFISFAKTNANISTDYNLKSVIRSAIAATLSEQGFPYDADVSVTLCDNEHIHDLNNRFRGVDRPTDVLSFPIFDEEDMGGKVVLGDIVLSLEKAKSQAEEYGHSLKRELCFLCCHSALHLLGYDHETEDERTQMETKQKEVRNPKLFIIYLKITMLQRQN